MLFFIVLLSLLLLLTVCIVRTKGTLKPELIKVLKCENMRGKAKQTSPQWNVLEKSIHSQRWFHIKSWIFTACTPPHPTPQNYSAMRFLAWGPLLVGWPCMKLNWHNPRLPLWIYNIYIQQPFFFIVLGQQLILCSQVGGCCTILILF